MRSLTAHEAEFLEALLKHGQASDDSMLTEAARQDLIAQIPSTRVHSECGCGTCPSIQLSAQPQNAAASMEIIEAGTVSRDAMIMLFVNDYQLSYLEVAPMGDSLVELPALDQLVFF
ncbi:hypothetical protein INS90_03065 [Trueperella pecoris]|uniref:Uncharacterized protein n=1 Tax=Trueperella pecoris TaxID=2733571 RepID=A0A7M1R438_9ACTO|nr:hypothetical protein [Trueperella pecoris]QOR48277.1 hypothetical protein INS90_03065 [Trueperella pecoris]